MPAFNPSFRPSHRRARSPVAETGMTLPMRFSSGTTPAGPHPGRPRIRSSVRPLPKGEDAGGLTAEPTAPLRAVYYRPPQEARSPLPSGEDSRRPLAPTTFGVRAAGGWPASRCLSPRHFDRRAATRESVANMPCSPPVAEKSQRMDKAVSDAPASGRM